MFFPFLKLTQIHMDIFLIKEKIFFFIVLLPTFCWNSIILFCQYFFNFQLIDLVITENFQYCTTKLRKRSKIFSKIYISIFYYKTTRTLETTFFKNRYFSVLLQNYFQGQKTRSFQCCTTKLLEHQKILQSHGLIEFFLLFLNRYFQYCTTQLLERWKILQKLILLLKFLLLPDFYYFYIRLCCLVSEENVYLEMSDATLNI
eukprot:TRINITY_DN7750_c2_g1_i3.p1 TRINITY_DN7750_c2_g1~~TRINITY_DN7750_c2_g1_i3.p1  ORF type:complete len:202 (-),score=-5.94 TRINITY_DN7750_c2_g1_i3:208-813(-)